MEQNLLQQTANQLQIYLMFIIEQVYRIALKVNDVLFDYRLSPWGTNSRRTAL